MDPMRTLIVFLHIIFVLLIVFIVLFSKNLITVITTGMLVYGAMIINYKCGDCPLSIMEDNYIDITSVDRFFALFLKDHYYKDLRPLLTLEIYWVSITIILLKVLYLFALQTFKENLKSTFL